MGAFGQNAPRRGPPVMARPESRLPPVEHDHRDDDERGVQQYLVSRRQLAHATRVRSIGIAASLPYLPDDDGPSPVAAETRSTPKKRGPRASHRLSDSCEKLCPRWPDRAHRHPEEGDDMKRRKSVARMAIHRTAASPPFYTLMSR